jgi:cytochrome c biogenesis protein CcmG/thiol:disulfide interchange protein DsbE
MRWWATGIFALLCAILLWVFAKQFGTDPHAVPFMLVGKPAPAFVLEDMTTNERVTLDQFKGKPLVINFWATWCGPCKVEHPVLEWGNREYGDAVQFIGVVFEDTEESAKLYLSRTGSEMRQFYDPDSRMAVDYGCTGVPETYFIDATGTILDKHTGPIDPQTLARTVKLISSLPPAKPLTEGP